MNTCSTPLANAPASPPASAGLKPRYTVDGDNGAYAIRVELPGVKKEDISLDLEGDLLTIHARRSFAAPAQWKTLHRELAQDDFTLRLKLNSPVDESKIAARLEDGVLALTLPVKDAARSRTIPVD